MTDGAAIEEFSAATARARVEEFSAILHDCVAGGASVSFMWPFEMAQARAYWENLFGALGEGRLHLFAASRGGALCGTVQLWLDGPCNQAHRGDIRKLLVHRSARRQGLAKALMSHAEHVAKSAGLLLLTLDTVSDGPAEQLYRALGWQAAGVIPRYAKWPDGRFCDTTVLYKAIG